MIPGHKHTTINSFTIGSSSNRGIKHRRQKRAKDGVWYGRYEMDIHSRNTSFIFTLIGSRTVIVPCGFAAEYFTALSASFVS